MKGRVKHVGEAVELQLRMDGRPYKLVMHAVGSLVLGWLVPGLLAWQLLWALQNGP